MCGPSTWSESQLCWVRLCAFVQIPLHLLRFLPRTEEKKLYLSDRAMVRIKWVHSRSVPTTAQGVFLRVRRRKEGRQKLDPEDTEAVQTLQHTEASGLQAWAHYSFANTIFLGKGTRLRRRSQEPGRTMGSLILRVNNLARPWCLVLGQTPISFKWEFAVKVFFRCR